MKKIIFLILISLLFTVHIASQNNDSLTLINLSKKALTFSKNRNFDSAIIYHKKATELWEKKSNWYECVKNYRYLAKGWNAKANNDTAMFFAEKALKMAKEYFIFGSDKETIEY